MSDPDLTPSEEQVRRLLADARHDESVPDDVAVRLDRVLAELQGESRRTPAPVDLAARRRRRIGRNVLVAAAAVVVVGVGISRVDLSGPGDSDSSGSGSTAADAPEASGAREAAPGGDRSLLSLAGRPIVLHRSDFDQRVKRMHGGSTLNRLTATLDEGYSGELQDFAANDLSVGARTWCNDPAWGTGRRVAVRYDGKRGVLVVRPLSRGARVTDLYLCGDATPTRSTTVPAG